MLRRLSRQALVGVAFSGVTLLTFGSVAGAVPPCNGSPNLYAEGRYPGTGYAYGVQSTIVVGSVSAPPIGDVTDQHVYVSNGAGSLDGLEVGWFIGQGVATFYTSPHLFATNFAGSGYSEQDGVSAPAGSAYWYSTWWNGAHRYYRVDTTVNGSLVWNTGSPQGSNTSGPSSSYGYAVAGEEAGPNVAGLSPGPSRFNYIQTLNFSGSWGNWTSTPSLCEDPNLVVSYQSSPYQISTGGTTN
jgi:hypothetical protein